MHERSAIAAAIVVMVTLVAGPVAAEATSLAARCPAYGVHLRAARGYLERGHRLPALVELRRAREALAACDREEADQGGLLSAAGRPTPRG